MKKTDPSRQASELRPRPPAGGSRRGVDRPAHPSEVQSAAIEMVHHGPDSTLTCAQWLPRSCPDVFDFFADAYNLERITPPFLSFSIRGVSTPRLEAGTRIRYRLRLHGVPLGWTTLIASWNPPRHFCDVQIRGPFAVWEHDHEFAPADCGTLVRDRVRYRLPLPFLRRSPLDAWIERDLRAIFAHRHRIIAQLFEPAAP